MAPARRENCQLDGCDYTTPEGLATQDAVLKALEIHLRFHELTMKKAESSGDVVERKRKNVATSLYDQLSMKMLPKLIGNSS